MSAVSSPVWSSVVTLPPDSEDYLLSNPPRVGNISPEVEYRSFRDSPIEEAPRVYMLSVASKVDSLQDRVNLLSQLCPLASGLSQEENAQDIRAMSFFINRRDFIERRGLERQEEVGRRQVSDRMDQWFTNFVQSEKRNRSYKKSDPHVLPIFPFSPNTRE